MKIFKNLTYKLKNLNKLKILHPQKKKNSFEDTAIYKDILKRDIQTNINIYKKAIPERTSFFKKIVLSTLLAINVLSAVNPAAASTYKAVISNEKEVNTNNIFNQELKKTKDLNILFYAAADNNLNLFIKEDIRELSKISDNKDLRIISLFDNGPLNKKEWQNAKLFIVKKGSDINTISKEGKILKNGKIFNSTSKKALKNFIKNSLKFPAKHNILIFSSHGAGYILGTDNHPSEKSKRTDYFLASTFAKAIKEAEKETKKSLDALVLDACLMGQLEFDYEIFKTTNIKLIAHSENFIYWEGLNYQSTFNKENIEKIKRSKDFVSTLENLLIDSIKRDLSSTGIKTFSIVENNQSLLKDLLTEREKLAQIINKLEKSDKEILKNILLKSSITEDKKHKPYIRNLADFGFILNEFHKADIKNKAFKEEVKDLMQLYKRFIVKNFSKDSNYTGLTTYIPIHSTFVNKIMKNSKINQDYPKWYNTIDNLLKD